MKRRKFLKEISIMENKVIDPQDDRGGFTKVTE